MKRRHGLGVAAFHSPPKNVESLFTRDDAIMAEKRGPFFANSVLREITYD
jgi:hypothetical protein